MFSERCLALTALKQQCKHRSQSGKDLCGKHVKMSNVVKIKTLELDLIENISPNKKRKIIGNEVPVENKLEKLKKMSMSELMKMVRDKGWHINFELRKKEDICADIQRCLDLETKYGGVDDIPRIVKCQARIRGILTRKENREKRECVNCEDFYSMDSLMFVDKIFFIRIFEEDRWYGFDIRSIYRWVNECRYVRNKIPSNPYTMLALGIQNLNIVDDKQMELKKRGLWSELGEEYTCDDIKQLEHNMVRVFQKFDALDHYTDHLWFKRLGMEQLKRLYVEALDLWCYRAGLSNRQKRRLRTNGRAFEVDGRDISRLNSTSRNKRYLQDLILAEFEGFADQGINDVEKKLGTRLMLCALTLVSVECAEAYPYLLWSIT